MEGGEQRGLCSTKDSAQLLSVLGDEEGRGVRGEEEEVAKERKGKG